MTTSRKRGGDSHHHHNEHAPEHQVMTHQGDVTDPRDIDHVAVATAAHEHHGSHEHGGTHAGHGDGHAGHAEIFRRRFWICLILSIPVVIYSEMIQDWFNYTPPSFTGSDLIAPVLGTIIFLYGGSVFLQGGWSEIVNRKPGMMLLISLAITVAFVASVATTLDLLDLEFWWELALLVTIMLLGHWLEMRAVGQARGALDELAALLPDDAERITPEGVVTVPLAELRAGDLVLVRPGARVPADGVIEEGSAELDESMITGESQPVSRETGERVIAGTVALGSSIRVRVDAVGDQTTLAGIQRLVEEAQQSRSRAQALADRFAGALFYIAAAAGIITFIVWTGLGDVDDGIVRTVTVLVISCPHALGLAIPLVIAISTSMSAKQGILVKDRLALERMREVTTVLFDKTGTLTRGDHVVTQVVAVDGGDSDVLALAAAAEIDSEHPVARAIVGAAEMRRLPIPPATNFRSMTGRGVEATVEGAEVAVGGPALLRERSLPVPPVIEQETAAWVERGAGVLYVVRDGAIIGALALEDEVREESREAVDGLHNLGIRVVMITGDAKQVADAVAKELNIDEVFAEVLPEDKDRVVAELQQRGERVAMVGDGINDAPALARADVGIAIGAGTDVAIESAGVVLIANDPRAVLGLYRLSQASYRKMIENLAWAAGYNVIAIPLAAGILAPIGITLSPAVGAVLMSLSTIVVALNAQLLRRVDLRPE